MIGADSIKINNYKCFGEEPIGFDKIMPMNILIGKNNSGKSSMIDIIEFVMNKDLYTLVKPRKEEMSSIFIETKLQNKLISDIPPNERSIFSVRSNFEYAKSLLGINFTYTLDTLGKIEVKGPDELMPGKKGIVQYIENKISLPFSNKIFYRISAERDVPLEIALNNGIKIQPNGDGTTNLIRQIINLQKYNRDIVENGLLTVINEIVRPDISFIRIAVEEEDSGEWQIYFRDEDNNQVGLSKMGSGVKTILLVVLHLIAIPKLLGKKFSDFVFAFEELENNLHPSILRRLFYYIIDYSEKNDVYFFITTHSNIVIDLFGENGRAQIIHVQKTNEATTTTSIQGYSSGRNILKDLDFRCSDLLLSNGIIWVEGPSDTIFIDLFLTLYKKAIGIENEGRYNYTIQALSTAIWKYAGFEGIDWNKITNDDLQNKIIALEKVNQNHLLVIDNDKNYENKPPSNWNKFKDGIGKHKARLIHSFITYAGLREENLRNNYGDTNDDLLYFWINEGTVETYLKWFILNKGIMFSKYFDLEETRGFFEKKRTGENSSKSKVELAGEIAQFCYSNGVKFEDLAPVNSSLEKKIILLSNTIDKWNGK